MLLALHINHLSPHQSTSVLGRIISNNLALNMTVNLQTESFDNNCTLSMEVCCLYRFIKTANVRNFYDDGGEYVHQYNDTVREFN